MDRAEFDDLWVVVPAYNEAQVLAHTLEGLCVSFPHICVVDDASTDGSAEIARALAPQGVRVVAHPVNLGQGAALQTGIDYCLSDRLMGRLVTFDADGQHAPADAVAMARRLGGEVQVVLGSRFLVGRGQMGRFKRLVLKTAVAYTNASTGLKLTDTHNGLRAMTRGAAALIDIKHSDMTHATEILEQVAQHHLGWVEHPVTVTYSDYSRSKGQSAWNSVNILVELLLR
jgi:glycosyltransferase involved in cell wall biosynthesis